MPDIERRPEASPEAKAENVEFDTSSVEERVEAMRAGKGLGSRVLGEHGTTSGTTVEAEHLNGVIEEGRLAAGHSSDPGMGGRTARGNLGSSLDSGAGDDRGERRSNQMGLPETGEKAGEIPD